MAGGKRLYLRLMRYPAARRRIRPLPIAPVVVPFAGGVGLELDFEPLVNELELEELFEGLAIRWRGITGTKKPDL